MIVGSVNARLELMVRLSVRSSDGPAQEIETLIDTGFDGALCLPPALIATLGLAWRRRGMATLADGRETVFDIYEAMVVWDGQARNVNVDAADTAPLIGTTLLRGYELTAQIQRGGSVILNEIHVQ
jgi:clan AA aspartic protease